MSDLVKRKVHGPVKTFRSEFATRDRDRHDWQAVGRVAMGSPRWISGLATGLEKFLREKRHRKIIFLMMAGFALPSPAAKKVTVEQLDTILTAERGRSDTKAAQQLSGLQLTERVSSTRLADWSASLPGKRSQEALMALADIAVFLDPPAGDIPATPTPAITEQQRILSLGVSYVRNLIPRLPNFLATRATTYFEDSPAEATANMDMLNGVELSEYRSLHMEGKSSTEVAYRDGREVAVDPSAKGPKGVALADRLSTTGEFGPLLAIVIADAAHGTVAWSHWERGAQGATAVLKYVVPKERSHYRVLSACEEGGVSHTPGYRGEMAIDPTNGSVLRLTVLADMDPSCQVVNVDLEVEYAAVAIGADIYVCPVKSVSLLKTSLLSADRNYRRVANAPVKTKLNDVSFSQYHLFRSEVRILADGGAAPAGQTANSESGVSEELPQGAETEVKSKETKSGEAGNGGASRSPASEDTRDGLSKPVQSLLATCPPVAGTANDGCEGKQSETSHSEGYADSTKPSRPISVQSAHAEAGSDSTMVLRESASLVLVDVIVTERGIPVHGVARERFHVFEDGNEQTINSFDEHFPAAKPAVAAITDGSLPPQLFSNVPQQAGGGALSVLLIDALNTSAEDSASVRRTVVEYLGKMEPDATLAIFTLSSRLLMVKGFTSDSSQLIKALKDEKKGSPPSVLLDAHDPFSVNPFGNELATSGEEIARIKTQQADVTADQTDERVRMTLEAMSELARYLGGIQGRKNVIWLSGSIPIALEPNDQLIDPMRAMRHYSEQVRETSDLLAAARVAVYPVDARGLMARPTDTVTHRPSPNIAYGRNNLSAAAQDNQAFESQTRSEHAAMETIAAGTGGRAFVSTNDLKGAIESAMADGSNYYTIGYRPMAGKSDGRFRAVRVQIDSGNYKLAYRSGYYNGDVKKFQATDDARKSLISAAVVHGAPPATQVLFKARLLDGTDPSLKGVLLLDGPAGDSKLPPGDAVRRYVAELTIDPHSITFDRKPEGGAALHLEVALVAYDSDGRRVNYLDRRMAMNLNPPQFTKVMADGVRARIALDVPAAAGSLRIAIEDLASPMIGSLEIALPINYR